MNTLADQYYLKAAESYPYCLHDVIIALGYALSYDEDHAPAHCLMGRLMMEKIKDYNLAAHHFEVSLLSDPAFVDTYKYYSMLQIWLGRYDRAEALIRRGLTVPGMETASLKYNRAILYEIQGKPERAAIEIIHVIQSTARAKTQEKLEEELDRLKRKIALAKTPKENVLMHERG